MSENAPHHLDNTPPVAHSEAFSLLRQLERQFAEFANGPTMENILTDMDRYRAPSDESVVEALHAVRRERDERWDETWQR
jgi:hypothetical protein